MWLRGEFRDRLARPGQPPLELPWRPNRVLWSALDLIGALLCNRSSGVAFLAVGSGDPAWDDSPPPADLSRTQLTAETWRVRLEPGSTLSYDAATGRLEAHVSLGPGEATGVLRELGLFGGSASPRPGSGTLVNHAVHPPIEKGAADTLERDVVLTLDEGLAPGARELVGRLLAREPGVAGLTHVALGTGAGEPAPDRLAAEALRRRLDPHRLVYVAAAHTVEASAVFDIGEGPPQVTEAGLFGGTATDGADTGLLVARDAGDPVDRTLPKRLEERFELVLVEHTGITVPALVGGSLDAAREALAAAALAPGPVTTRVTEDSAAGTVLEQAPAAGTVVNEAAPVALVVAVAPLVVVPEVVGEPEDQVKALLAQVGLVESADGRVERQSPLAPGTVLAASPPPGAEVPKGSAVALTVAVPVQAAVPDLRGRTPAAAAVVLSAVGLALAPEPHPTQESGASYGTIVAQDPAPETQAVLGSTVEVTLAAPWTVAVPDLAGSTLDAAVGTLAAAAADLLATLGLTGGPAGLTLGAVTERVDPAAVGTIVEQEPAAGARAPLYATVDVVVVSPLAGSPVPAVVGSTQSVAAATLAAAGFAAGTISQRPADEAPGTVVEQAPAAGLSWARGDAVALTVAVARTVAVPDVSGYSLDAATEVLVGLGLTLGQTTSTVEPGPPTIVLGQDPAARSVVAVGAPVALVVRAGVPNVLGLTEADARTALQAAGVPLAGTTTAESPGPVGIVLSQTPAPGSEVTPGIAVTLTLSIAPLVAVPSLVGDALADATAALTAVGLVLGQTSQQQSSAAAEGSVLAQDPQAGTRVAQGSAVAVTIAVAPPKIVQVPNLVGATSDAAKATLAALGLVLTVTGQRPTAGVAPGIVIAQDPQSGSSLTVGSAVSVVVSSVDTSVAVPDVRQQQVGTAQAILAAANLGMQQTGSQASVLPPGIVLSQAPLAGSRVPAGTVVSVVVSAGGLVVVPNLLGMTQAQASAIVHNLGLGFTSEVQIDFSHPAGSIIEQDPSGGDQVPLGTVVSVVSAGRIVLPPPKGPPIQPQIDRPPILRPPIDGPPILPP